MRASVSFGALLLVGASAFRQSRPDGFRLNPVPSFDITSYVGHWFQMYDNLFEQATFENASLCDTADYALLPNGTVTVLNRERQDSVDGPERALTGYATCPDGPPACTVHLQGVPVGAPYYIVNLGPVINKQYQWAVVSDPIGLSLFILARNVTDFYDNYQQGVLDWCKANGFTNPLNAPLATQQIGCKPW